MKKQRVTPSQRRALDNLSRGMPINAGICTHGSQPSMIQALRDKKLIDEGGITESGMAVIGMATA